MREVRVQNIAAHEIRAAASWYVEQDAADAARRLHREVSTAIGKLTRMAHISVPITETASGQKVRRVRLRKFPYMLVYIIDDDDVVQVIAFPHIKQDRYWLPRL